MTRRRQGGQGCGAGCKPRHRQAHGSKAPRGPRRRRRCNGGAASAARVGRGGFSGGGTVAASGAPPVDRWPSADPLPLPSLPPCGPPKTAVDSRRGAVLRLSRRRHPRRRPNASLQCPRGNVSSPPVVASVVADREHKKRRTILPVCRGRTCCLFDVQWGDRRCPRSRARSHGALLETRRGPSAGPSRHMELKKPIESGRHNEMIRYCILLINDTALCFSAPNHHGKTIPSQEDDAVLVGRVRGPMNKTQIKADPTDALK